MSFHEAKPSGHNLKKLFQELPDTFRTKIDDAYAARISPDVSIPVFALMRSASAPSPPEDAQMNRYTTAEDVFASSANAFIRFRYFFEDIEIGDWAIFDAPVVPMLALSLALEDVYGGLATRAA